MKCIKLECVRCKEPVNIRITKWGDTVVIEVADACDYCGSLLCCNCSRNVPLDGLTRCKHGCPKIPTSE
jgi:hypothetical protein